MRSAGAAIVLGGLAPTAFGIMAASATYGFREKLFQKLLQERNLKIYLQIFV
jgi:hypothetical protein